MHYTKSQEPNYFNSECSPYDWKLTKNPYEQLALKSFKPLKKTYISLSEYINVNFLYYTYTI